MTNECRTGFNITDNSVQLRKRRRDIIILVTRPEIKPANSILHNSLSRDSFVTLRVGHVPLYEMREWNNEAVANAH